MSRIPFERVILFQNLIMKPNYISVPFKAEASSGLKEYNGIAKFSSAGIIFEFESKFLGLFGAEVKEVRVSLDEIHDIKFRKGFFKFFSSIQLRLKHLIKASELPNESGKIKLKVKREDFAIAKKAVEQTLQYLDEEKQQLPPAQTSVDELFETENLDTNKLKKPESENRQLKE